MDYLGTTIATKADLHLLRQESALMRKDLDALSTGIRRDLELLSSTMTVRLGSMLMLGLGLLFAALALT